MKKLYSYFNGIKRREMDNFSEVCCSINLILSVPLLYNFQPIEIEINVATKQVFFTRLTIPS